MVKRTMAGEIDAGESLDCRGLYHHIPEVISVRTKGAYANKEDCKNCESNIGGRCKTLVETNWIIKKLSLCCDRGTTPKGQRIIDQGYKRWEGKAK